MSGTSHVDASNADERRSVMSLGDHLEELRSCSIKALVGLAITTVLSLTFARHILSFLLRPALVVMESHGQRPEIQALSPPETFLMYLKMGLLCGLILGMPWVLIQVWRFVAVGLYSREQRFVRLFAPVSLGLFAGGVLFMLFLVLPVVLNFLVGFGDKITVSNLEPSVLQQWLTGSPTEPDGVEPPPLEAHIPMRTTDPEEAPLGSAWINTNRGTFCVMTERGVMESTMQTRKQVSAVKSRFGLSFYIGFVLSLCLAFGLAFELPLVVIFLTGMGIVTRAELAKARRYVILGIVAVAAFLTPPDIISQVLLAVPMIILFEGGLLASRYFVKEPQTEPLDEASSPTD